MTTVLKEAAYFFESVQDNHRREGLWLSDTDFVRSVAAGSAPREAIAEYTRQFFVAIEQLHRLAHSRPKLKTIGLDDPEFKKFFWENRVEEQYGAISNTAGHLELLIQLGEALGVKRLDMVSTKPKPQTRALIEWSKAHVHDPEEYLTTQIAIGILESMNPEASLSMAQGGKQHYGLTDQDIRFWTVHITADADHGEVALKLLALVPMDRWEHIREMALEQSRLVRAMWNSCLQVHAAAA
jgi:pyrroloquinoline quinone (PQQ) biosynthesis protein C